MKDNKILIIPDVHGRDFWKKALELIDEVDKVVFLGDYMDPYPEEGITYEDAIDNFKQIIDFTKKYKDKIVLLKGNHDYHYCLEGMIKGSRFDKFHQKEISEIFEENSDLFQLIYISDKYLFSHAPIWQVWADRNKVTLEDLLNQKVSASALSEISFLRGGPDEYGSCVWADIRECLVLFEGINYYYITGHTQLVKPYVGEELADLDVRKCFILDLENDKIEEVK